MKPDSQWDEMRESIIGLGVQSSRKTYYPELQRKIAELENARKSLADSEASLRAILDSVNEAIFIQDMTSGAILEVNQSVFRMLGYTAEEARQLEIGDMSQNEPPYTQAGAMEKIGLAVAGTPQQFEWRARHKSGRLFWTEVRMSTAVIGGEKRILVTARDISARKQAEAEQKRLESALLQAQKLESIGRLAGGVAHDFNNMLGVILGHAEMLLEDLDPHHPYCADLLGIREAAERSAELTRQLLAFARCQAAEPKIVQLNDMVEGMLKMLRRLIGEDITLSWLPGADIGPIKIDPTQLNQILANLCVNARDAIAGTGSIAIETRKFLIAGESDPQHPEIAPGEYALLTVSDTGTGIARDVIPHLFEPFFTTKELGKGTGLGLATVYGVVKQNGGFINVYSELGRGTTFKIYLPRALADTVDAVSEAAPAIHKGQGQLILLVEDEPSLLKTGRSMLERLGYTVLSAGTPGAALATALMHRETLQLLLTDVVMPEMNGRDLANRILTIIPGIKCIYTSGYTASVIAQRGMLEEGLHFIQKPYSLHELSEKVHEVLT